ncbi:hypothetical protein Glove_360g18 [Diversispora epigaea]|uniref:Uncharacterized protein n=1 Tax=Diversispora epigaea TaxID=1348612 RepID=A0A397HEA0_9GLOM|nr:hypothetical protein Glove_360g18 [Diversispora epigaea]
MANTQSKIRLLEELNSKLQAENTELRNKNTELRNENAKLRHDIEGHETRITKLEQGEKSITKVPQSLVNSNDTPEQIVSRCNDTPISDITDDTSNSGVSISLIDNTPDLSSEHILAQSKEVKSRVSNSTKLPEDIIDDDTAETLDFVETIYKERVSEEIMERIKERKHQEQNLSSNRGVAFSYDSESRLLGLQGNNNSSDQSNLSCDTLCGEQSSLKTVTLETNLKDSTKVSESKSPTNLLPNQKHEVLCSAKIPYNQKVERGLRLELFICTKNNNHKISKVFDIQIPEFSLEAILSGSSKVTSQNIVDLFRVAMKIRQKESLCWNKISQITYSASAISSLKDIQIQNIINDFPKSTDMSCQAQSAISSEIKVIGVTNCHAHISDLSSLTDSSAELARSKLSEIKVSEEAKKTLLETEATHDHAYFCDMTLLRYSDLYKTSINEKFDYYDIIEGRDGRRNTN